MNDAIREITQQLKERGDGKVHVNDWDQRYWSLAVSQKAFLESRPDLFALTYEGRKYRVALVSNGVVPGIEDDLIREIKQRQKVNGKYPN